MTGRSDAKLKGGVREVTAGSRYGGGPLGEACGLGKRAGGSPSFLTEPVITPNTRGTVSGSVASDALGSG